MDSLLTAEFLTGRLRLAQMSTSMANPLTLVDLPGN